MDNTVPTELPYDDALNVLDQSEMPGGVQELEQPQSQQPQLEVEDYDDDVQNAENNEEEEQKAAKTIKRLIRKTGV
ncbi:hypothetical protein D3C75_760410 [compost metagenome]